jgi:drug/metabolite transporter (DMT)-like permease
MSDPMSRQETTGEHHSGTSSSVWIQLGLMSTMWGSAFLLMKVAVPTVPAFAMAAVRGMIAAGLLWLVIRFFDRERPQEKPNWIPAIVLGTVSGWLPNVLTAWALLRLDSSVAGMLSAAAPIFVVVLAHFFLASEKLRVGQIIGILIGFGGVALIIGVTPASFGGVDLAGQLAMVAVALSYAAGTVYARTIKHGSATGLAMRQQFVSGAVAGLVAVAFEQPWDIRPEPIAIGAILALAIWASALPIWMYFRMLAHTKAVTVSLVAYLIPAVAVLLGALVLGEQLEPTAAAGLGVVLFGVYITTRPQREQAAPPISTAGIQPDNPETP